MDTCQLPLQGFSPPQPLAAQRRRLLRPRLGATAAEEAPAVGDEVEAACND